MNASPGWPTRATASFRSRSSTGSTSRAWCCSTTPCRPTCACTASSRRACRPASSSWATATGRPTRCSPISRSAPGAGLARIFAHCEGFDAGSRPARLDARARAAVGGELRQLGRPHRAADPRGERAAARARRARAAPAAGRAGRGRSSVRRELARLRRERSRRRPAGADAAGSRRRSAGSSPSSPTWSRVPLVGIVALPLADRRRAAVRLSCCERARSATPRSARARAPPTSRRCRSSRTTTSRTSTRRSARSSRGCSGAGC